MAKKRSVKCYGTFSTLFVVPCRCRSDHVRRRRSVRLDSYLAGFINRSKLTVRCPCDGLRCEILRCYSRRKVDCLIVCIIALHRDRGRRHGHSRNSRVTGNEGGGICEGRYCKCCPSVMEFILIEPLRIINLRKFDIVVEYHEIISVNENSFYFCKQSIFVGGNLMICRIAIEDHTETGGLIIR